MKHEYIVPYLHEETGLKIRVIFTVYSNPEWMEGRQHAVVHYADNISMLTECGQTVYPTQEGDVYASEVQVVTPQGCIRLVRIEPLSFGGVE